MNNETMWEHKGDGKLAAPPSPRPSWPYRAGAYVVGLMDRSFGETNTVDRLFLGATFLAVIGALLALLGVTFGRHR